MIMHRFGFVVTAAALTVFGVSGCATKNYVKNQTAPLVNHAGELDQKTSENSHNIQDVNQRAQAGIKNAQNSAEQAQQSAQTAAQQANQADTAANDVAHRADSLDAVVKGLDNYKQVANVSVTFGFDKSTLTAEGKQQLDGFANQLGNAKSYILEVTGGTDTTGPAQYNYELSQRRADTVVQYLASKYNIPAHRFYLIGIGEDKQVAPDNTAEGRKKNRRVEVQLLSNMNSSGDNNQQQAPASTTPTGAQ
jgi:OmpA-OmpF porin, OOP family